jgi:DNA-binding NtrC family response regulator
MCNNNYLINIVSKCRIMSNPSAIILSNDEKTVSVCSKTTLELGVDLVCKKDFPCMLLELQENDYKVILCDCSDDFHKCSNWIKVIKKIRPKLPLIVLTKEIDKSTGGKLYQEGIFDLCEKPLDQDYLKEIISAILNPAKSHDKINKFNNI